VSSAPARAAVVPALERAGLCVDPAPVRAAVMPVLGRTGVMWCLPRPAPAELVAPLRPARWDCQPRGSPRGVISAWAGWARPTLERAWAWAWPWPLQLERRQRLPVVLEVLVEHNAGLFLLSPSGLPCFRVRPRV
jgi:hypothetical protein